MSTDRNIVWHTTIIGRKDREGLLGQKGLVLWFTGLSGSGKSTVANSLEKKLFETGRLTYMLDGDNLRHGLNRDLGFTLSDRTENIRRVAEIGKLFIDAGIITLSTFISPLAQERDKVRQMVGPGFIEIFVDCPLHICEGRDPKGLYKKARAGEITNFTGLDSPYEKPVNPELTVRTDIQTVDECVDQIIRFLSREGFLVYSGLEEPSEQE